MLADGFTPRLVSTGSEVEVVITPSATIGHIGKFVVEVNVSNAFRSVSIRLGEFIRLEPSSFHAVTRLVLQDAVEVNLCLRRTRMDTLHDALHVGKHLLRTEVQTTRSGNVVRANHHENLLGLSVDVGLEVVALLRGISARIASVHNGQILTRRGLEGLGPTMHVRDTVTDEHDVVARYGQDLKRIVAMIPERPIGKDRRYCKEQQGDECRKSFHTFGC